MRWIFNAPRRAPSARTPGFTIIELLVVIAIIVILAGLLLPTLSRAKQQALSTACLNNLKQLQLASLSYSHDHNDELVPNHWVYIFDGDPTVGMHLEDPAQVSWCPGNVREDQTTSNIIRGVLFQYNTSTAIYHCPADRSRLELTNAPGHFVSRTRSYNLNIWLNCLVQGQDLGTYFKLGELGRFDPSHLFAFIDVQEDAIVDPTFGIPQPFWLGGDYWWDLPADRHLGGANLSFLDGHVEHWRWRAAKNYAKWVENGAQAIGKDLLDLRRLQGSIPPPRPISPPD
jgi:prepilin-type processing-associated H-X9-DG protein/prepilin-type N-terminal cleavage/methylation domain-containing protein